MNMTVGTNLLSPRFRIGAALISELLMAAMALFMAVWGTKLVQATWGNSVDAFPWLSVGITYLPIPVGGFCLLLFIFVRILLGSPPDPAHDDAHPSEL